MAARGSDAIRLFATGGTFDKEYDEINGRLFFKKTHVEEMLELGRCSLHIDIETLMMIDSLDMKLKDRELILYSCKKATEDLILITHGTDTMSETAAVLGKAHSKSLKKKTVVLTGAMVPYRFGSSDGMFNLGSAVGFVQSLPPGVYVAMNGRYFNWDNVMKDRKTGSFKKTK